VAIVIQPFTGDHVLAVRAFNRRIAAGGESWRFPESPARNYPEYFVALEGNTVRGAYILKPQAFAFEGQVRMIANFTFPISEGIVDGRYVPIGLLMLKDSLKRQPLLFGLGLGGYDEAIARMLANTKWRMVSCPFYFKVTHPFRFLRETVFLRRTRLRRLMLDTLAVSGLGWMAVKSLQSLRKMTAWPMADLTIERVDSFSLWADEVWTQANCCYAMIGMRDATSLNRLYPSSSARFQRIKVLRRGKPIGWAVVLNTQMQRHKYFGRMRVGSVVDCLAVREAEDQVVAMATEELERQTVDIIVTNQLQRSWCRAFASNGYLAGPSNFIFAVSPELAKELHPFDSKVSRIHMTRGDGDGPINL
jgi:hypothetical protein